MKFKVYYENMAVEQVFMKSCGNGMVINRDNETFPTKTFEYAIIHVSDEEELSEILDKIKLDDDVIKMYSRNMETVYDDMIVKCMNRLSTTDLTYVKYYISKSIGNTLYNRIFLNTTYVDFQTNLYLNVRDVILNHIKCDKKFTGNDMLKELISILI